MAKLSDDIFSKIFNKYVQRLKDSGVEIVDDSGYDGYGHHYVEYENKDGGHFVDVFFVDEENCLVTIIGDQLSGEDVSKKVSDIVDNPENFETELSIDYSKEQKESLNESEVEDDFGLSDVKKIFQYLVINEEEEEGLEYLEQETRTGIHENDDIVMIFEGKTNEFDENFGYQDEVHVCYIHFDNENQYLLEKYLTEEDFGSYDKYREYGSNKHNVENTDKYIKFNFDDIINHKGETLVGLNGTSVNPNNVNESKNLKENEEFNSIEKFYEEMENYDIDDDNPQEFKDFVYTHLVDFFNDGFDSLEDLINKVDNFEIDSGESSYKLKMMLEDELPSVQNTSETNSYDNETQYSDDDIQEIMDI